MPARLELMAMLGPHREQADARNHRCPSRVSRDTTRRQSTVKARVTVSNAAQTWVVWTDRAGGLVFLRPLQGSADNVAGSLGD